MCRIGEGMWSTEGVETNTVEKTEDSFNLACTSQHFTSFAAIVSTNEVRNNVSGLIWYTYITLILTPY